MVTISASDAEEGVYFEIKGKNSYHRTCAETLQCPALGFDDIVG
jgi:hypothetical protein